MSKRIAVAAVLLLLVLSMYQCGTEEGPTQSTEPPPVITTLDTIPPETVDDLVAKLPSPYAIYLVWTAPGDDGAAGNAASYDIRYHDEEINEGNWSDAQRFDHDTPPSQGGVLETVRVTSLDPVSTYFFAVKATDDEGNTSGISNSPHSTTLQEVLSPISVGDLAAVAVGERSFLLTWTAPGDDGDEGTASQYDVRYSTSPVTRETWDAATQVPSPPVPKPGGEPDSMLVSGLSAATNYHFALKAADEVPNWSDVSNDAFGLGFSVKLMVSPNTVEVGDEVAIIYRAPGGEVVTILLYRYAIGGDCNAGHPWVWDVILPGVVRPEGIYEMTYNFSTSPGVYLPAATYYVAMCWSQELESTNQVILNDPE